MSVLVSASDTLGTCRSVGCSYKQ